MSEQRILPADVYDALELSALAFGGIGGDLMYDSHRPRCLLGHIEFCDRGNGEMERAVRRAFGGDVSLVEQNDPAVERINKRRGTYPSARVPFDAWCKELNVVRGK